jgi:hypothetical protein
MPNIADDTASNVRSAKYVIVESRMRCPQCKVVTAVFAFALPVGYESLYVDDDTPDDESGTWEAPGMAAVLSYVEQLPESVANCIRAITSHYRVDRHIDTGHPFWMNHCEHCAAQMEEEELHSDLEGPFGPTPHEGLGAMRLHEVREPFEARVGGETHTMMPLNS